jgi:hypothetical protein
MFKSGTVLQLSASDLVGHLNCRYLTKLDLDSVNGRIAKPQAWDPLLDALAERGALHERAFVEHLHCKGLSINVIEGTGVDASSIAKSSRASLMWRRVINRPAISPNHSSISRDIAQGRRAVPDFASDQCRFPPIVAASR